MATGEPINGSPRKNKNTATAMSIFPVDLQHAFDLGKHLVEEAK